MAPELGGSQISALLESVPGIRNVLRSPVADAMVNMIRAAAGTAEFRLEDANELVQFAVRRGLISADEGDQLLVEAKQATRGRRGGGRRPSAKKRPATKRRATKRPAKNKAARTGRPVKKAATRKKAAK